MARAYRFHMADHATTSHQRIAVVSNGIVAACALSFLACTAAMVAAPRAGLLAHTLVDDAYYYLEIAARAQDEVWPSFDGVRVTTGFHPLWAWILVPIATLMGEQPWAFLRVVMALSASLMFFAGWRFVGWMRRVHGPVGAAAAALCTLGSFGFLRFGWMGMEGPLALLLAVCWLERLDDERSTRLLGALGGLMILARLDMVMLVGLGSGLVWLRSRDWKRIAASAAITGAIVAPALGWNVLISGRAGTISSATKQWVVAHAAAEQFGGRLSWGFVEHVATWGAHYVLDVAKLSAGGIVAGPLAVAGGDYPTAVLWHSQRGLVAVALLLMLFAIAFWAARGPSAWPHQAAPRPIGVDALVIAAVAHLVAAATLLPGQAGPWYWGLELLAIAAVATQLCVHASSSRQLIWSAVLVQGVAGPLVFVGIIQAISSGKFDDRRSFASTMWQLHVAVQKTVPGDAPIGSCNAGALGFMSERSIVNLDGLVNDWTFLEARRRGAVRDWVDSAGIRWFADCVPRERQSEYRRHLGYGEDEVEVLFRSPSAKCEGFLWRLGPKKRLSSGPADGQVSHFENTDAGHELSVAAGKAAR